jgi:predicted dienelactone hydrolase
VNNHIVKLVIALTVGLVMSACSPQQATTLTVPTEPSDSPTATRTAEPSSTAAVTHPAKPTNTQSVMTTPTPTVEATGVIEASPTPVPFLLSEPGPYFAGKRSYTFVDDSRAGREVKVTIRYPALEQTDAEGEFITDDALPDMSGAPYPLILTGSDTANYIFKSHLTSHGFVMAIVHSPKTSVYRWDYDMIDNARDLIFTLDQIATYPPEGLEGVIDSDHVGTAGYSGDGNTSFAVSGARIDPEFYLSQCEQVNVLYPTIFNFWNDYACSLTKNWDEFASLVGIELASGDGLWPAITDERIRAVISMAAASPWLYGQRGLASVDRPVLIISPTKDQYYPHEMVTDFFKHIGNPERVMISFVGRSHGMPFTPMYAERINYFVTAFFGYYLQGSEGFAEYFSEDFVAQYDDLAWGVFKE